MSAHETRRRSPTDGMTMAGLLLVIAIAAVICAALIVALQPLLQRYALARPNARSSHQVPTPQGGGIAVVIATIAVSALGIAVLYPAAFDARSMSLILGTTVYIALVGVIDDIRTIGVPPRLILQAGAVALILAALPEDLRIVAELPWLVERVLLLIGGVWLVNLVNFMDGIDWITAAEVIPVTACLVILGSIGEFPPQGMLVAAALGGAMVGFAPFNKPVARLFLGDVGSLPIGLLLCWLLILLAGNGHLAAAILLPLYYAFDATITLALRIAKREPFWQAHRSHFYQRALDGGLSVTTIVSRIFAVNVVLVALAVSTVVIPGRIVSYLALACGAVLVGWLLSSFARARLSGN
jgi:UDP-N-acetylmuramyl pentapeptide phosphotransferase/UDP-N-acetylglucosamine-1-phosphate transferase